MAPRRTSADVIAVNSSEEVVGAIWEIVKEVPELLVIPAGPVEKTMYKTLVRTGLPTAGFRAINTGRDRDQGTIVARVVQCYFLDASWDMDNQGLSGIDWGDPLVDLVEAHLTSAFHALAAQTWYGINADAAGFVGVASLHPYTDSDRTIDAGGTTADTASSVFALRLGPQDVSYAWGNDGEIRAGGVIEQQLYDGAGKAFMGRAQAIEGWAGLQLTNYTSTGRILNLTDDAGAGLTDDRLSALIATFPANKNPNVFFMSKRSRGQLQMSRTATNGSGTPAPWPVEAFGIPIHESSDVSITEAIATATP